MIYNTTIIDKIDQGDILYPIKVKEYINWWEDEETYPVIILTPTCDIAHKKVDHHRFAVLEPFPLFFLKICQEVIGDEFVALKDLPGKQKDKISNKLRLTIRNAWPRYHFLPKEGRFKVNRIIDFEVIFSVPLNTFLSASQVARLESPYREELVHRYSHHTMRIGTEDLSKDKIEEIISECFLDMYDLLRKDET